MSEQSERIITQEYEGLLGALAAYLRGDKESHDSFVDDIRYDLSKEYNDNIEEKIQRWIDVTRAQYFHKARPVDFYMQAKMLYRDGFFEAAIMMGRSIAEMVCYELLLTIAHPFGSTEEVERQNFRKLLRFLFEDAKSVTEGTFKLLSQVYDIGNSYVHPKSNQKPEADARICLLLLGEVIFELYGVKLVEEVLKPGTVIESAYVAFPSIGHGLYLGVVAFSTPEAAKEEAKRWGYKVE